MGEAARGPKRRRLQADHDIVTLVQSDEVSADTLALRLTEVRGAHRHRHGASPAGTALRGLCPVRSTGHIRVLLPLLFLCRSKSERMLRPGGGRRHWSTRMQQGMAEGARQDLYLVPESAFHQYGQELHSAAFVLRLLQPA